MTIPRSDDVHVMLSTILEGANLRPATRRSFFAERTSESLSDGLFICFDQDPESAKVGRDGGVEWRDPRDRRSFAQDSFQSFEGLELIFVDEPRAVYAVYVGVSRVPVASCA